MDRERVCLTSALKSILGERGFILTRGSPARLALVSCRPPGQLEDRGEAGLSSEDGF